MPAPRCGGVCATGIAELDSHYILLVPAHIVPNPVITGYGEPFPPAAMPEVIGATQGGEKVRHFCSSCALRCPGNSEECALKAIQLLG